MAATLPISETAEVPLRRLLSTREFQQMVEAGILQGNERIELIEGELLQMSPIGNQHVWLVFRMAEAIQRKVRETMAVLVQSSVELSTRTQLQPDVAVLGRKPVSRKDPLPGPADVLLIVEVADSSLMHDRTVKLPLYARAGIPEVWIVDVESGVIDAHRRPAPQGYAEVLRWSAGDSAQPALIPEVRIDLDKFFA